MDISLGLLICLPILSLATGLACIYSNRRLIGLGTDPRKLRDGNIQFRKSTDVLRFLMALSIAAMTVALVIASPDEIAAYWVAAALLILSVFTLIWCALMLKAVQR